MRLKGRSVISIQPELNEVDFSRKYSLLRCLKRKVTKSLFFRKKKIVMSTLKSYIADTHKLAYTCNSNDLAGRPLLAQVKLNREQNRTRIPNPSPARGVQCSNSCCARSPWSLLLSFYLAFERFFFLIFISNCFLFALLVQVP